MGRNTKSTGHTRTRNSPTRADLNDKVPSQSHSNSTAIIVHTVHSTTVLYLNIVDLVPVATAYWWYLGYAGILSGGCSSEHLR